MHFTTMLLFRSWNDLRAAGIKPWNEAENRKFPVYCSSSQVKVADEGVIAKLSQEATDANYLVNCTWKSPAAQDCQRKYQQWNCSQGFVLALRATYHT